MKKLLIILFIFSYGFAAAETIIEDGQEVYGTWSAKGSPYIVKGEAIVPVGKTLKIKPGTVVKFKTGIERDYMVGLNPGFDLGFLRVRGTLIAKGKAKKRITFTRDGSIGYWGIVFIDSRTAKNLVQYCTLSYGYHVRNIVKEDNGTGVISFFNATGKVAHNLIVNNGWTGINCKEGANPLVINNTFSNNEYGIECNTGSSPELINNIVWGNGASFYINGGAAPKLSYSLVEDIVLEDGVVDKGHNLIGENPGFTDPLEDDFTLKTDSPCLKKGKEGKNMGAL